MVFADFCRLLDRQRRSAFSVKIDLQRVKQQQHIPGADKHSGVHPRRNTAHGNHKFVEQRRSAAVWKNPRHGGKELAAGGILGHALTVPAGMDDQNTFAVKGVASCFAGLRRHELPALCCAVTLHCVMRHSSRTLFARRMLPDIPQHI